MSIADKLTYLNTTKQLLKTEINKINNVLTDQSTFRSYPQELFNGYLDILNNGTDTLWNNLEKVSASGEEATLENVETAPIKMVLNGNTSQDTTSGKNLIAPNNLTETTVSGVTFTPIYEGKELKYINVNGTSTSLISYDVSTIPLTLQAGTYFLSGCPTGGGNSTYELGLRYASFPRDLGNGVVLNLSAEATYSNCRIVIQNGVTVNNQKFYPMLEKSSTATPYEPYTGGQPSPSPDYPQEVKVVKGENVVSVQGKNLIDQSNVLRTLTYNSETGYYEGTSTSAITTALTGIFEDNVQYTFKYLGYKENAESEGLQARFTYTDGTENHINFPLNTTAQEHSITSLNGKTVASFEIRYLRQRSIHIKDLMLYRGTDINTPYVPYSKTDYPINLGTLELCKIGNYKDYLFKRNGKWYVHKAINKVVLNGSENWSLQSVNDYGIANFKLTIVDYILNANNYSLCDKFSPQTSLIAVTQTIGYFLNGNRVLFIRADSTIANTLADFKTWLSNNNVTLYYVLATPTEEEITNTTLIEQLEAISKAKSVKDKTYITQTNDELPFILDVQAIKEYEVV